MKNKNDFKSPFDNARYNLSKNLTLLSTILLSTIGILFYFENDFTAYPVICAGLISFVAYILTLKTKRYRLPVILCLSLLSLLNVFNLTVISNFHHVGDYFWIICIVTAGFLILGKRWGIGLMVFNMLSLYIVFYLIREGHFIQLPKPYTSISQINFFINICIGSTLFSFFIIEFLNQNKMISSDFVKANKSLTALNEEKSVMLKEIHHRVKNNLQIITSLLRLQSSEITDKKSIKEFSDAINRISAIAKIHDKMYNNKMLNRIALSDYLNDLLSDLIHSYTSKKKIETTVFSNINSILPKDLVPIALLFNELVTNSIKHAFHNKFDNPKIAIHALLSENNKVKLKYSDNGKWALPQKATKSIGIDLIESFVDQLDGTYYVDKKNGTHYTIEFTLKE